MTFALVISSVTTGSAQADYGPGAVPASASGDRLGDLASTAPSISDDGRFVVFRTQAVNLLGTPPTPGERYTAGLVRRDMITGAVQIVSPPRRTSSAQAPISPGPTGGGSISASGRYVLFDTSEALTAGDQNTGRDVYVRDMDRPVTDGSAYELVSALDATDAAPDYLDADPVSGSRAGVVGAAISDDGRTAVFRTEARSSLPTPGETLAPPAQVFVRQLDTHRTLLMTRSVADGKPVGAPPTFAAAPAPVLSGDGRAVAWVDTNPGPQTALLAGEQSVPAVLWRDVGADPSAPTRRVAGRSDPEDPGCPAGAAYPNAADTAVDPCLGPFVESEVSTGTSIDISGLSISDDGRRVLFATAAQQRPFDPTRAGRIVYLADMTPGVSRKQGVRRVLRGLGGGTANEPTLAGDGTRLAFTARGSAFEGLRAVGSFPKESNPPTNVFVADLDQGTVQRATVGADGSDLRSPALDPLAGAIDPLPTSLSISDDAGSIAFTADDANLFLGDANGVADVQVVRGTPGLARFGSSGGALESAGGASESGARAGSVTAPNRVFTVIGQLMVDRRGIARMTVRVPAAGLVTAISSAPKGKRKLRVARQTRRTKSNATVHLRLAPTAVARKVARRSPRLKVKIEVRYAPTVGRSTATSRSYTLTRKMAR